MDSLFANLYQALETRIKTNITAIRGVYPELGQTENYNGNPFLWPCVFIDFTNLTYSELTGLVQAGTGELQLRFAFPVTNTNGVIFLDTNTALNYYEIELKLHQLLQGWAWTSGSIAPLTRTKTATEDRDDAFRVRVLTFSLNFNEYPAQPVTRNIAIPRLDWQP